MKKKLNAAKRSLSRNGDSLALNRWRAEGPETGRVTAVADWMAFAEHIPSKRLAKLGMRAYDFYIEAVNAPLDSASSRTQSILSAGLGLALLHRVCTAAYKELDPTSAQRVVAMMEEPKQRLLALIPNLEPEVGHRGLAVPSLASAINAQFAVKRTEPPVEVPEPPALPYGFLLLRDATRSDLLALKGIGPKFVDKIVGKDLEDLVDLALPRKILDLLSEIYYC